MGPQLLAPSPFPCSGEGRRENHKLDMSHAGYSWATGPAGARREEGPSGRVPLPLCPHSL